ncbi:hypothetical protein [Nocardia camponoti]|uniref:Uncharacterized protein n=1 Tax=Nocardia camponoti TaxID=1616106 RepID=A0A917QT24_9NOCA|nr:hypothetical protein [Nocardia camponoti]GGK67202.1 hypothetical protein GCM10011591_44170 [Nocardia camponoti]
MTDAILQTLSNNYYAIAGLAVFALDSGFTIAAPLLANILSFLKS